MTDPFERSTYGAHGSSLRDLPRLRANRRGRASSWDRTGGDDDFWSIGAGETVTLAEVSGAGCIDHIWMTTRPAGGGGYDDPQAGYLRNLVLRMFWDGEETPSVEVPLGDFFGAVGPTPHEFVSLPVHVSPAGGKSLSAYWHMPFGAGARIELTNDLQAGAANVYFYIDYQRFATLEPGLGRFHACWRRENPCRGESRRGESNSEFLFGGTNLSGDDNYVILDATGCGHYVGCFLSIHNLRSTHEWNWYGEGDEMIFVDGEGWPPTLHGTGTEDYFGGAYCPSEPFSAPYCGLVSGGGENWSGVSTMYRFHVEDPIPFQRSIRVTIEHGHANRRSDDYASTAFWYQEEPHRPFGLQPAAERVPRPA